jgi:NodT family efflux transporter outer membrane factor (OMF) lipoprotein
MPRPMLRSWALSACVAGLTCFSGCTTLGPDAEEPDVAWLQSWESDLNQQLGDAPAQALIDLEFWWRSFDDPILNELITLAEMGNPNLRIAGLRIIESRAALGIALSQRYPQVQQTTGGVNYVNKQYEKGDEQSFSNYQAGGGFGWEGDFWGRFQRGIESADAAFFASIANQRDLQVLLHTQVATSYYAYRTSELRIQIAQENAAIQKRSFEITEHLFNSGQNSELDLQQAKTQYLATLSSVPNLEITAQQTLNALCSLLGRAPGDLPEVTDPLETLPVVDPSVLADAPAMLLMRRPDVRSAAWQIAAQSPQIGIAEAQLYPSVSLFGSIDFAGNSLSGNQDTWTLGIGPSFTWNIFDHGSIRNNVRIQDVRLQQAIESFQNVVLKAAQEIDNATISVRKTREEKVPLSQSVVAAKRSLDLANTNYREGYADFQRVLDGQRSVASQTEAELINSGQQITALIALYGALGGGWSETSVEQLIPESTRETMEARSNWDDLLREPLPASPETVAPNKEK